MIQNSRGKVYYGMHFYPGVAEYSEHGKESHRVYLNEDTIRAMDPSFAGRPVFVQHVDEVSENLDELRKEVDGWVLESFYNAADGKHWAKFIIVSERGERAITRQGMRLSNCYIPKAFGKGGIWNGVAYAKEITGGEYEHLAIVANPRYDESLILTPDEFKKYNEEKNLELERLTNEKKDEAPMALKLFQRKKVDKIENGTDLESLVVVLPKSGKEYTIQQLASELDDVLEAKGKPRVSNGVDTVEVDGKEMTVAELVKLYNEMCKKNEDDEGDEDDPAMENADDEDDGDAMENEDDEEDPKKKKKENEDDEEDPKKKKNKAKKKNALTEDELKAKRAAKEKADRVRNARERAEDAEEVRIDLSDDRAARGKKRYGSN